MKYNFELIRSTKSGKFRPRFYCEHCNKSNLYVGACLYTAKLNYDYRYNLPEACQEFVDNINNRKFNMFNKKLAGKHLKSAVCNCSVNVVSLKAHKAKLRVQSIFKSGFKKHDKK